MCGIVGIVSKYDISNLNKVLKKMNDEQTHRGPDGEGLWMSDNNRILFGHKRLSIIDTSNQAAQPMSSYDGRFTIIFNGEIYNYRSLRRECEKKGSRFKSNSDTETIIECYRHFGIEMLNKLRGMWAFALFDSEEDKITLSKDPFGIKPLHYGFYKGNLYFASEIKSLHVANRTFNEIDEVTCKIYEKYGNLDYGEWTFFKNIKRFPAAHYAVIDAKESIEVKPKPYWLPPKIQNNITLKEAIKNFRCLMQKSVERHMRSDVPIAFCLSGGLDSSSLVCLAKKASVKNQSLNTFTTHYPDFPEIDESKWAKIVSNHCKTTHTLVNPNYDNFVQNFDKVLYHHDEPYGSTSVFAQYEIFNAIKNSTAKVSLDGQGADEALGGYQSLIAVMFYYGIKNKLFFSTFNNSFLFCISSPSRALKLFKNHIHALFTKKMASKLFLKNKQDSLNSEMRERLEYINSPCKNFEEFLIKMVTESSLPNLLRNGDRMSMANSVESRVPFLDIDVINFLLSLPANYRLHRGITKYILRKAMEGIVPHKVIYRKDKLGFPSPEKTWLQKAFKITSNNIGSTEWRKFILNKWRNNINN